MSKDAKKNTTDTVRFEEEDVVDPALKERIVELKKTVFALQRYNVKLRDESKSNVEKQREFHKYFAEEMKKRHIISEKLEKDLGIKTEIYEKSEKGIQEHYASKINDVKRKTTRAREYFTSKLAAYRNELNSLAMQEAKENRHLHDKEIVTLKREIEDKVSRYSEEASILERELLAKKRKLTIEMQRDLEKFQHRASKLAEKKWIQRGSDLQEENGRLAIELRKKKSATRRLVRERERLQRKLKDMKIVLSLSEDRSIIIEKQTRDRTEKLRNHSKRAIDVKDRLTQRKKSLDKRSKDVLVSQTKAMNDLKLTDAAISEMLTQKLAELSRVRSLAENLVHGRSEVERFFIDALSFADMKRKEEERIFKNRQKAAVRRASLSLLRPNAQMRGTAREASKTAFARYAEATSIDRASTPANVRELLERCEDIEFRGLSWKDRGRLLKMLFAKINSVCPASGRSRKRESGSAFEETAKEDATAVGPSRVRNSRLGRGLQPEMA